MKKTVTLTFFSLFVYFLLVQGAHPGDSGGNVLLDRVVATINDEVVTWSELRGLIAVEAKQLLEGVPATEREERMQALEKEYLNKMIDVRLQLQEAGRLQVDVSPDDIDNAVQDIKTKYSLTDETLTASLMKEGLTLEEYRKNLEDQILLSKIVSIEVKSKVFISDGDIEKYYESNRDKYHDEEKVKIRQIFFSRPADNSEKRNVETKARDAVKRLRGGEDFSQLAGELSEDPGRESGGDLGYIKRGNVMKEVEDVAFALKRGEVSDPFWSSAGLHIIMVEDIIRPIAVEKVRKDIRGILFEESFRRKHLEWIKRLRERAYIEIQL